MTLQTVMSQPDLSLDEYREHLTAALYQGLCIRDFPCQEAERHNKPEVEFGSCSELLLPAVTISRQSGEACCIEPSINSCRVSFTFRQGDNLDQALAQCTVRYLGLRAKELPILRRKPIAGYQVSFLVTAAILQRLDFVSVVEFLVRFAMETPSLLRELKCTVSEHARRLAAQSAAGMGA